MGWNSWNKFACNLNETLILDTAQAIIDTGLAKLGYNYINLGNTLFECVFTELDAIYKLFKLRLSIDFKHSNNINR
jgi:hypothetical protein